MELDEQKYPLLVKSLRLMPDSGGAGRQRGAPGTEELYGFDADVFRLFISGWF